MNNDWLLLHPRLDVAFKDTGQPIPPKTSDALPSIRIWWMNFYYSSQDAAEKLGVNYEKIEKPLWQFKEEDFVDVSQSNLLIPHKEFHNFMVPGKRCFYYMQTVIPHLFSIDRKGWAGNLSVLPFREQHTKFTHWDELEDRALRNISKFDQPLKETNEIEPGYVLFICQLPHDQTIQYHSSVSVIDALRETIAACKRTKKRLVVKGHPVNPDSMAPLKQLVLETNDPSITWIEWASIHTMIKNSTHCVTVNSGSGIEVLLHKKPIFAFGKAEYSEVAFQGTLDQFIEMASVDEYDYMNFIESYVNSLYDTRYPESFEKLFQGT